MPEEVMTPPQAANYIGVSDQTIYNWLAAGVFEGVRTRGLRQTRYFIPKSEVERVRREGNYGLDEEKTNGLAAHA